MDSRRELIANIISSSRCVLRKSYAMEIAVKPLVMASEVSGLEPLHGFIKREKQPEFLARKLPTTVSRPVLEVPAVPAPKPPQAVLPLFDAPQANSKGVYVRDKSKRIDRRK